jgi:hypothetical protein
MSFLLFIKSENRRAEQVLSGGLVPVGEGRLWGEGVGGWIWSKYCVHVYVSGKMRPAETIPGMGGRGNKREWQKGWIQLWYIVRTFVNITMCSLYNNNKKKRKEKKSSSPKLCQNTLEPRSARPQRGLLYSGCGP